MGGEEGRRREQTRHERKSRIHIAEPAQARQRLPETTDETTYNNTDKEEKEEDDEFEEDEEEEVEEEQREEEEEDEKEEEEKEMSGTMVIVHPSTPCPTVVRLSCPTTDYGCTVRRTQDLTL